MTSTVRVRADWQRPTVRPDRPRILLGVALLAAAMPIRLAVPMFGSVSVLDVVLVVAALTLFLDLPHRRLATGPKPVFVLLGLPPAASVAALAWSQDRGATLAVATFSLEAMIAYLFVLREVEGLCADRIVSMVGRFVVLLVMPALLLLLRVPGFEPQQPGLSVTSGDYLSYFTRLSHPVLGRSNNLATALVIFLPLLLWWGHEHRRLSATIAGMVGVAAVLATQSRGVLVATAIALVIFMVADSRRRRGRPVFGKVIVSVGALAAGAAAFYALNAPTREFVAGRLSGDNFFLREDLYRVAFVHLQERPLLGFGSGVVPDNDLRLAVDVHNTYVQQMLSFGVPLGALVGLTLLALPVVLSLGARTVAVAGAVSLGVAIEVLSFVFESSYEGTVLRVIFYLSMGLLVGVLESCRAATPDGDVVRAGGESDVRETGGR